MDAPEPEEDLTPEQLVAANEQRIAYLRSHGAPVPMDEMYSVSLLEFLVLSAGGENMLANARHYHERRVAPILDRAVGGLARRLEEIAEARAEAEAEAQSVAARSVLLGHLQPPR